MKMNDAFRRLKTEDNFYDQASRAFQIYQDSKGSALTQDDFLKLYRTGVAAQHVARKEAEFKAKTHAGAEKIKEKLYDYFVRK